MKQITLKGGKVCLVDDNDYELLSQYTWHLHNAGYARRTIWDKEKKKKRNVSMHREIMGLGLGDKREVDHIDFNGLNNQRSNLRICTRQENARHIRKRVGSISKFLGVFKYNKDKRHGDKYRAQIKKGDILYHSKRFPFTPEGEISAALWYNEKAKELFGEFANLNIVDNPVKK